MICRKIYLNKKMIILQQRLGNNEVVAHVERKLEIDGGEKKSHIEV